MPDMLPSTDALATFLKGLDLPRLIALGLFGLLAFTVLGVAARAIQKSIKKRSDEHTGLLVSRIFFYAIGAGLLVMLLHEAGFELGALLGAAGIFSLAVGLAAQAGLSNIISGLFIYWERPFKVGDLIRVNGILGLVLSIDLTSVKLRKLDNIFVRIPNEDMVKAAVENITRYPIRRMDIDIGCAYKHDPKAVMEVLRSIADNNPLVLDEPEPLILFQQFGDSSLNFMLGVWFEKSEFVAVKNSLLCDIKARFDAEGIEIPFPHRSLYSGEATAPFPIRIVGGDDLAAASGSLQPAKNDAPAVSA